MGIILAIITSLGLYTNTYVVTDFESATDTVVVEDTMGNEWAFYGIEDYQIGDDIIAVMYDNSTMSIYDDSFVYACKK